MEIVEKTILTPSIPDCVKTNRRRNLRELRFKSLRLAGNLPALKGHLTTWRKNILCCLRVLEFSHSLRGFNLEDTRLTNPEKIDLLLGVLALAMAWASKTAARLIGTKKNPRKSHGYYAKSWFRVGFDHLRHLLRNNPENALACWNALKPQKMRVV